MNSPNPNFDPQNFHLLFWDFDGVIKDSVALKTEAFDRLFGEYDAEVRRYVREHHALHGGVSRYIKIPYYFRTLLDQELSEEETEIYCQRYAEAVVDAVIECDWIPGAREFLITNPFEQQHVIVTGTPQTEMEHILRAIDLESPFSQIFGAPHTKPAVLAQLLQETGLAPDQCLMIGDSMTDFDAAVQNKVPFLLRENPENQGRFGFFEGPRVTNFVPWLIKKS